MCDAYLFSFFYPLKHWAQLLLSFTNDKNLIHFVFFIEIYQIWPENFEEIIVISSIKTIIPPDKQHEWVKRAKYQKTAHRPFSIDLKIVQNVIFSKNTRRNPCFSWKKCVLSCFSALCENDVFLCFSRNHEVHKL